MVEEYRRAMEDYRWELAAHEKAVKRCKRDAADPGRAPAEPVCKRIAVSDTTIEALGEILSGNPRGVILVRDELAGWMSSFTRYKQRGGSDMPLWLEAHQAGQWTIDRKHGDPRMICIRRAAVSILGGIQPGVLARALTPESLEAGLGARLLIAMPERVAKKWSEIEVHPENERMYCVLIDQLLALRGSVDDTEPLTLRKTPAAHRLWIAWFEEWATAQAMSTGEVAAALAKIEGGAARLALIHHVVTHIGRGEDDAAEVAAESMEAGIAMARWFAAEAVRVYGMLHETPAQRDCRAVVELMRARGGRITVRELCRANNRRFPTADTAQAALRDLVASGRAKHQITAQPSGGHPLGVWELLDA